MSAVVHIDPAGRRAMDRDYLLVGDDEPRRQPATVIPFTSRLERGGDGQCTRCGRQGHRASKCTLAAPKYSPESA